MAEARWRHREKLLNSRERVPAGHAKHLLKHQSHEKLSSSPAMEKLPADFGHISPAGGSARLLSCGHTNWASCGGVFSLSDRLCSAIFPCSPAPILAAGWLPLPPYFPEEMGLSFHFPFPLSVDFKEHGNTYDTRRGSAMCVSPWAGYVTSVSLTSLIHKFGWEFWGRII